MNYYKEIKNELVNNEITKKIKDYSKNRSDLTTYYNVGKLLGEVGNIIFSKSQSMIDLLTFTHYCAIIWFDDIVKSLEKNMIQIFMCLFKIKIKNNCIITMEML